MGRYDRVFKDEKPSNESVEAAEIIGNAQADIPNIPNKLDFFDPDAKDERGIPLHYLDPRSDLSKDHSDWMDILNNSLLMANLKDGDKLFEILHFLRCSGAGLERVNNDMGLKLVPGHWSARDAGLDWAGVKDRYLSGIRDDLVVLFKHTKALGRLEDPAELFGDGNGQEGGSGQGQSGQKKLVFGIDTKETKKR